MGLLNPTYQGGVKNYLGDQELVNAPKYWKSGLDNPETELAYITKAEKDLIVKKDIHGSLKDGPNKGPSGIISLDSQGDKGTYGQTGQSYGDRQTTDTSPEVGDRGGGYQEPSVGGDDIDSTYLASDAYFEPTYEKTFVDKVIDYYKGGGLIGVIAGNLGKPENQYEGLVGETDYGAGDYVSTLDDWAESRGLGDDYSALDAEGQAFIDQEAYDAGWRSPAVKELYEGGDTSNLENLTGSESAALEQLIPMASYAVANQTPVESQVDKWFANNQAGTGLDPNYMTTYNTAKANIAATLGMVDTSNQFGYSDNPYGGLTAQNLTTNPFNIPYMQNTGLI